MTVRDATELSLEIGDLSDPPVFAPLPGLRLRRVNFRAAQQDGATDFSAGEGWVSRRPDGLRSARLSAEGLLTGAPAETVLRDSFLTQQARPWRFLLPGSGRLTGPFLVETLDYSGAEPGQAGYALALISAGALTFTPDP